MTQVTRNDWEINPLPDQHTTLTVERRFNAAEMAKIRQGFQPWAMEDRWFAFFEDGTLYLHRSWSGHCIYEADFVVEDDKYIVQRLRVNRDTSQYKNTDDAEDINRFLSLVDDVLLWER